MAAALFATQLGMGIINPILPIYAKDLGATGLWIGVIAAAYSISRAICMPPIGWLSDRKGRKIFLTTGLAVSGALSFGYAFAPNVEILTGVRLLHGVFSAMIVPIANAYIGDLSPEGQEGRWMGYANTAFFIGAGVGPMLGGWVADNWGIQLAFNVQGFMNLLAFLSVLIFVPEMRAVRPKTLKPPGFKSLLGSNTMRGLLSYRAIYEGSMAALGTFLPIYCAIHLGMDKTQVGILLAVNLFTMSILQLFTGHLSDKSGRRFFITFGGVATFILIFGISFTTSFWMILGIMVLRGISSSFSMPAVAGLSVSQGREFGMASVQSAMGFATSAGAAFGPILAGLINDAWDVYAVFYFSAGIGIAGTIIFFVLSRGYRQKPPPARGPAKEGARP
jgi:MFS family permease